MSKKKKTEAPIVFDGDDVGNVCVSLSGHDAGRVMVVVGVGEKGYLYIADGKTRRISEPKLKKTKHTSIITKLSPDACEKISSGKPDDSFLRREIARVTNEMLG